MIRFGRPGRLFAIGLLIYVVVLVTGILLLATGAGPPSRTMGLAAALGSAVAAVLMLLDGPVRVNRREGVERLVLRQATSIAFFATMGVAVTLGLLEVLSDMEPASPWALWAVGMATWGVSSAILHRRVG